MIKRPATILALLTGLNLLNYLDRMVVSAVLPKLEDELGLSHFLAGFLGTIFLIGYFLTSPFFGSMADRGKRKGLIAAGVLVWSLATCATGLAAGKLSLIAARAFVGVGEASYATLAPTIIDDLAPPEKKSRWLAVFFLATPVGSALGYLLGGAVEHAYGWRYAFFVAGTPGILAAGLCLLIAEPARKLSESKPAILEAAKTLLRIPLYRRGVLGYCAGTFAIGGFAFWAPGFLFRAYNLSLGRANFVFGVVTVIAGAIGTAVGGFWSDAKTSSLLASWGTDSAKASRAQSDRATVLAALRVCSLGAFAAAPVALIAFLSPAPTTFFAAAFVCVFFVFMSNSPINAVLLRSIPEELRASSMALAIFMIHLLGDLWSPPLVGFLADHMEVRLAMMVLPLAFLVSGRFWWVSEKTQMQ